MKIYAEDRVKTGKKFNFGKFGREKALKLGNEIFKY